jgi:signal transduction histidine kinase/ligand-binding sensor domain-containing protein/DNA-binding NarL/FixJ family response regulator
MRASYAAILSVVLATVQHAHAQLPDSFQIFPPSITTRIEKYRDLDQARLRMINNLTLDRAGFLWAATSEGLVRFDGYDARLYNDDPADTLGRSRTPISSVAVDREGFIWGASSIGLRRLDPLTGRSRWYMVDPADTTAVGTGEPALLVTGDGELWVGGPRGIARYIHRSDSFTLLPFPKEFTVRSRTADQISICELDRWIWVGSLGRGIAGLHRDNLSWKISRYGASGHSVSAGDYVTSLSSDRSGTLWVGSAQGLERYHPATDTWDGPDSWRDGNLRIPRILVSGVVEDDFGGVWTATMGAGLFRIDPANGQIFRFLHNPTDPTALLYNQVWRVNTSRGGGRPPMGSDTTRPSCVVWVPHGIQGVSRIILRNDSCTRIVIPHKEATITHAVRAMLCEPTGKVWVGIYNANGHVGLFDLQHQTCRWYAGPIAIARMGRLSDRSLLVTTQTEEVWWLDRRTDTFTRLAPDLKALSFFEENDSSVWLGCQKNGVTYLSLLNRRTRTYAIFPRGDSASPGYQERSVTRICADDSRYLWYGTWGGGLIRFDRERKSYTRFASHPGSPGGLADNSVIALVPDSAGALWVGTQAGLDLMNRERGTFEHMRGPDPTRELLIREMTDDGRGHLWIASLPTVVCFTKARRSFRCIAIPEEYREIPIPWGVTYEPSTGMVTVGMAAGFFMFPADAPPAAAEPPPVHLTSFRVFDKPHPLDARIWSVRSVTLPFSENFVSFTFAALDFMNSAENRYSYNLEGLEPDWSLPGSRRYVSYSNLEPGRYVFRVKGANSEGIWNESGSTLEIIILPPWYRTPWAYGAYALLAGGMLFLTWWFDRRRTALKHSLEMKDLEAKKMHEVDQMKSRFFANISHEFRTPLTLILGPIDQLAAKLEDKEVRSILSMMRRNATRLLQLINQLLDLSRIDAGKMSLQIRPIDLVARSRAHIMAFLSLAERKRIHLVFDPQTDDVTAYMDPEKYETILTNLISNAIKYTGDGGEVKVGLGVFSDTGGRWTELTVADTGVGIDAENLGRIFDRFYRANNSPHSEQIEGTGIGLTLTKELVELHGGSIEIQSIREHGSTFTVRLPIGKEHWEGENIVSDVTTHNLQSANAPTIPLPETVEGGTTRANAELESGKPMVLIVEDNADVRSYIRGFLQEVCTIIEAKDGREALKKTHDTSVDLVISDVMMPEMDGVTLCKTLKDDDRTSHIPVILLTARASSEGKLEGLDVRADDYIIKPFDAREVVARAKNLIELRKSLRDRYSRQVTIGPSKIEATTADEQFLNKFKEHIERHIGDAAYDTEKVAYDMCMSRMQLNRKIHALTGYSTYGVIREFRLQRAAELLRDHVGIVAEVAMAVGFNNSSHFARAFRERFGVLPSEFAHPVTKL